MKCYLAPRQWRRRRLCSVPRQVPIRSAHLACVSLIVQQGARGDTRSQYTSRDAGAKRLGEVKIQTRRDTAGQRETRVPLPPPLPGARQRPPRGAFGGPKWGSGESIRWFHPQLRQALHLPSSPLESSSSSSICLLTDRSWRCHDSAPQGTRSAGSYTPRSGGGLGVDAILDGRSYDSSLEGSLDPLFGGCMNSNVGNHGKPCVCTGRTPFLEK